MLNVLITGVNGGVGSSLRNLLLSEGYVVYGLDIVEKPFEHDNYHYYKVNIRDNNNIAKVKDELEKAEATLSAIINTSGIYDLNSLLEISEEDIIKIFDINFFGIYRINKAFSSLLKEKGKIIIISSELAPLDPLPFTGLYGITKSTVEKYAYSLRMEMQLLGHQVVVIRPGAIDTGLLDVSTTKIKRFKEETKLYQYNASKFLEVTEKVENRKIKPDKIAKLICKVLKKKKPKYIYSINRNKLLILLSILPKRLQNYIIKKILQSKEAQ